jgi:hypothetical protein
VTQLGVETRPASRGAPDNPAEALAGVVENATALARAELRLVATEARAWLVRVGLGLTMLWLSLLLIQVFVLLLALSPVLLKNAPWTSVGLMLLLSLVPTLAVLAFGLRELRRHKDVGHELHLDHDKRS